MSSKYIRDMFESWLEDPSMVIPFYETINKEVNPQDDIWCTVDYSSSSRDTITYCGDSALEEGELEVVYFGKAGIGDDALLQALEADIVTLMAQRDPAGKFILMQRSAPYEFSGGSADKNYGLTIYIDYQYYT